MALTDPVPSQAIDVFKRNMEDSDRFVNQTSGTVTNRTGKTMRPLPVISDDIEQQLTDLTADVQDIDTFNTSNSDTFIDNVGTEKKTIKGIENDARIRVSQVLTDLGISGIKVLIQLSTDPFPNPLEWGEGQPLKFSDTLDEFTLINGAWVENGNVGDEVPVTAASHLTLAQAQASDLRVGQYVILTDRGNSLFICRPIGLADDGYITIATPTCVLEYAGDRFEFNIKLFGAVGDGVNDDAPALQRAHDYLVPLGGGTIKYPNGAYRMATKVVITGNSLKIVGTGMRKVYPGQYVINPDSVACLFSDHTGRAMIEFFSDTINAIGAITFEDISFSTVSGKGRVQSLFGWKCGNFQYDFNYNRCSIFGFDSVFDVYTQAGNITLQQAALNVENCNINGNNFVARTLNDTAWNLFRYVNNNSGQNGFSAGRGCIDIKATGAIINDNILEGQRDSIKITGINSPTSIKRNYFEENTGFANIHLTGGSRGSIDIGPNYHFAQSFPMTNYVMLSGGLSFVTSQDQYWPDRVYRATSLPMVSDTTHHGLGPDVGTQYTSDYRWCRLDDIPVVQGAQSKAKQVVLNFRTGRREENPLYGGVMQCADFSTGGTAATNRQAYTFSGVTAAAGEWLVVSILVKFDDDIDPVNTPYVSWVSGVQDGSQDMTLAQVQQAVKVGDFYMLTVGYRCQTAITSASVGFHFYPYGVSNTTVGLGAALSSGTLQVVETVYEVTPWCDERSFKASGAPTSGTWKQGDRIENVSPTAGAYSGWVYTPTGWKGYGLIEV